MLAEVFVDLPPGREITAEQGKLVIVQVVDGHGAGMADAGVVGADDEAEGLGEQRRGLDARQVGAREGDAEVEPVVQEIGFDAVLGDLPYVQGDPGVTVVETGDERAGEVGGEGGRDREPEAAAREVLHVEHRPFPRRQVP